jgi:hypothetical protein
MHPVLVYETYIRRFARLDTLKPGEDASQSSARPIKTIIGKESSARANIPPAPRLHRLPEDIHHCDCTRNDPSRCIYVLWTRRLPKTKRLPLIHPLEPSNTVQCDDEESYSERDSLDDARALHSPSTANRMESGKGIAAHYTPDPDRQRMRVILTAF